MKKNWKLWDFRMRYVLRGAYFTSLCDVRQPMKTCASANFAPAQPQKAIDDDDVKIYFSSTHDKEK